MYTARSFDINKPGARPNDLHGGVIGGSLIQGVFKKGEEIEIRPGRYIEVEGRQKVMSLRNIELTAPYMHNGVFKTLEEVVHFYNTRDVLATCEEPIDITNSGFGITCWPEGEFHSTRNIDELGNLGLSKQDEADLVAYLKTFTDNYPKWGNSMGRHDSKVPKGTPSPFADFHP